MTVKTDTNPNPNRRIGVILAPNGKVTLYILGSKPVQCPLKAKVL